jgi:hypothetical protein
VGLPELAAQVADHEEVKTYELSTDILDRLLVGVAAYEAALTAKHTKPGPTAIVSDNLGDVFKWLWRTDVKRAVEFAGDFICEVQRQSAEQGKITDIQILDGIRNAIGRFPMGDLDAMSEHLQREVPRYLQRDIP